MGEADAVAADAGNQAAKKPVDLQLGRQVGAGGWWRGRRREEEMMRLAARSRGWMWEPVMRGIHK